MYAASFMLYRYLLSGGEFQKTCILQLLLFQVDDIDIGLPKHVRW